MHNDETYRLIVWSERMGGAKAIIQWSHSVGQNSNCGQALSFEAASDQVHSIIQWAASNGAYSFRYVLE